MSPLAAKPLAKPFPFAEAMQFGFGVLQLSSDAFWRMTPRELAAAIMARRGGQAAPLERNALDQLMQQFPDRKAPPHD
ncbi:MULTISPECIES: rcc01693 family protein [Rhodopseudomonas]|uniref:Phage tail assembly chaperone n=1 Tax=Rhodopseudomonas palustris TaxID=1076 RepID=A0A0D7E576_RHOPL|nr:MULTISPECIES: rcc01693 family protein [Rhodopseudomonas]KIZ36023.1 hypothetical protein OO17_25115 [Rhodopseudomonas palustris]MDF3808993.1 phage tail assembly chaperone [Rhodopseudomonas sp. BAL398]WOK19964.1 phage tail assembly chaperone [Rhodopseudomonas sp. BAL398]